MILHDCAQGTTEWFRARAGIPTASMFGKIVKLSGGTSKSARDYMFRLLAERLMGRPIDEYESTWMKRGRDLEPDAVAYYEGQRNLDTNIVGFITNDARTIGASPDRLVGDEGLAEIKVPAPHTHVEYLLDGVVSPKYKAQTQGQLWIAERAWVDFCSYHPEMPRTIVRVERDEDFIERLRREVGAFSAELEERTEECRRRFPDCMAERESRDEMIEQLSRSLRTTRQHVDPDDLVFV
jgi:hypothetical protein